MNHNTPAEPRQKCFKLFRDARDFFCGLNEEQVGKLVRAAMEYGNSGTIPTLDDMLMMYFRRLKQQVDQDAEQYENRCRQNSINAKKRYANKVPTKEEAAAYFKEESLQSDPDHFFDHYEARGWCVNSGPIKDWKALARAWEKNGNRSNQVRSNSSSTLDYIDMEDLK